MNPKADFYFEKAGRWQKELEVLRTLVLNCGLNEEVKWGTPCYVLPNAAGKSSGNLVLIHVFKEYCALLFFKGALLSDPAGILIQQTENVQAARQMRFTSLGEVKERETLISSYIYEAIEVEKAGLKVQLKKSTEFAVAEEFQQKLDILPALKAAFEALTPGRQRAYLLHFSAPKQSKTRISRIEKCMPMIMEGKGLND